MKKYLLLLGLLFVVGFNSDDVNIDEIHNYIEDIKEYAEINRASEEYVPTLQAFNDYLDNITHEELQEYIDVQIEANNMRIEGLQKDDADLITESSFKQAKALEILYQLEES